eukprot:Lithocolla_globosa_v1_NODE_328_length_4454_cov_14.999318.p1 type:complete len:1124 gc:universal NODE_328_length_4454_cov_14.999318:1045-4416(+)
MEEMDFGMDFGMEEGELEQFKFLEVELEKTFGQNWAELAESTDFEQKMNQLLKVATIRKKKEGKETMVTEQKLTNYMKTTIRKKRRSMNLDNMGSDMKIPPTLNALPAIPATPPPRRASTANNSTSTPKPTVSPSKSALTLTSLFTENESESMEMVIAPFGMDEDEHCNLVIVSPTLLDLGIEVANIEQVANLDPSVEEKSSDFPDVPIQRKKKIIEWDQSWQKDLDLSVHVEEMASFMAVLNSASTSPPPPSPAPKKHFHGSFRWRKASSTRSLSDDDIPAASSSSSSSSEPATFSQEVDIALSHLFQSNVESGPKVRGDSEGGRIEDEQDQLPSSHVRRRTKKIIDWDPLWHEVGQPSAASSMRSIKFNQQGGDTSPSSDRESEVEEGDVPEGEVRRKKKIIDWDPTWQKEEDEEIDEEWPTGLTLDQLPNHEDFSFQSSAFKRSGSIFQEDPDTGLGGYFWSSKLSNTVETIEKKTLFLEPTPVLNKKYTSVESLDGVVPIEMTSGGMFTLDSPQAQRKVPVPLYNNNNEHEKETGNTTGRFKKVPNFGSTLKKLRTRKNSTGSQTSTSPPPSPSSYTRVVLPDMVDEETGEVIMTFGLHGEITRVFSGTKEQLIDYVYSGSASEEYVQVFLLCYRYILTPQVVFQHCLDSFLRANEQNQRQLFSFLMKWLASCWFDFDLETFVEMSRLINTLKEELEEDEDLDEMFSSTFTEVLEKHKQECQRRRADFFEALPSLKKQTNFSEQVINIPDLLGGCPIAGVAQMLTRIDFSLFRNIQPEELMIFLWGDPDQSQRPIDMTWNLSRYVARFNEVSNWVATEVCAPFLLRERKLAISRILRVMLGVQQLGNYNTLMAMFAGLNSASVQRLKLTWGSLSKQSNSVWRHLSQSLSPRDNYSNYRDIEKKIWNGFLIPFFGLVLKDLTFSNDGNPKILENGLINFDKLWSLSEIVHKVTRFQTRCADYLSIEEDPIVMEFCENLPALSEQILYRRSLVVEPRVPKPGHSSDNNPESKAISRHSRSTSVDSAFSWKKTMKKVSTSQFDEESNVHTSHSTRQQKKSLRKNSNPPNPESGGVGGVTLGDRDKKRHSWVETGTNKFASLKPNRRPRSTSLNLDPEKYMTT